MVSAWPEAPFVIPAEWPVGRTAGARSERKHPRNWRPTHHNRTPMAMRSARVGVSNSPVYMHDGTLDAHAADKRRNNRGDNKLGNIP
jgi:hypothetical protein